MNKTKKVAKRKHLKKQGKAINKRSR